MIGFGIDQLLVHIVVLPDFVIPIAPEWELACVEGGGVDESHHKDICNIICLKIRISSLHLVIALFLTLVFFLLKFP